MATTTTSAVTTQALLRSKTFTIQITVRTKAQMAMVVKAPTINIIIRTPVGFVGNMPLFFVLK